MKFRKEARLGEQGKGWQVMRKRFWATVTVLLAAAATTALAAGGGFPGRGGDDRDDDQERGRYAIGLWGDLPYSDVQAQTGVPNLIADMNSQDRRSPRTTATSKRATESPAQRRPRPAPTPCTSRALRTSTR